MSELLAYLRLGYHHIVALDAVDHLLFLAALAAVYRPRDWRAGFAVLTAFTLGHSLTLGLAVTRVVELPVRWIEFLIPVTIVVTCVGNLAARGGTPDRRRAILAGLFGLVHGAGFAEYLRSLFLDRIAVPLVGFNLGIEAGQIVVLSVLAMLLAGLDRLLGFARPGEPAYRRRVILVSGLAGLAAAQMAAARLPV